MKRFGLGAVAKAATTAASKSFELTGPRSRRFQDMLLDWGGDGYVPSQQRGMIDYLCTNNGEFWEIVRVSSAAGSRIIGLVHLDSLRCIRTGDPETPLLFVDLRGQYHELRYHQVVSLVDMPDPAAASRDWSLRCRARLRKDLLRHGDGDVFLQKSSN